MTTLKKYYMPLFFPLKKEYMGLIIIVIIFLWFPSLSRAIDITSAAIDPGALSAIILAVTAILVFKAVTWWLIRSVWPVLEEYSQEHFERNFKSLHAWQKVVIYLVFYMALLYAFILGLIAII